MSSMKRKTTTSAAVAAALAFTPGAHADPVTPASYVGHTYPGTWLYAQPGVTVTVRAATFDNPDAQTFSFQTVNDSNLSWLQAGVWTSPLGSCAYVEANDARPGGGYTFRCVRTLQPGEPVHVSIVPTGYRTYSAVVDGVSQASVDFLGGRYGVYPTRAGTELVNGAHADAAVAPDGPIVDPLGRGNYRGRH